MDYETRELTKEEGDALTKDMQELLQKHSAELGVISSIQLLKRVSTVNKEPIPSFLTKEDIDNGNNSDTETESGG